MKKLHAITLALALLLALAACGSAGAADQPSGRFSLVKSSLLPMMGNEYFYFRADGTGTFTWVLLPTTEITWTLDGNTLDIRYISRPMGNVNHMFFIAEFDGNRISIIQAGQTYEGGRAPTIDNVGTMIFMKDSNAITPTTLAPSQSAPEGTTVQQVRSTPPVTKKPEAPQEQGPGQQAPAQNRQPAPQQQKPQESSQQAPSQPASPSAKKTDRGKVANTNLNGTYILDTQQEMAIPTDFYEFSNGSFTRGETKGTFSITGNNIKFVFSDGKIETRQFSSTQNTIMIHGYTYVLATKERLAAIEAARKKEQEELEAARKATLEALGAIAMSKDLLNWADAKAFCEQQGGRLPRINNSDTWAGWPTSPTARKKAPPVAADGFGADGAPWPPGVRGDGIFDRYWTDTVVTSGKDLAGTIWNDRGKVAFNQAAQRVESYVVCVPHDMTSQVPEGSTSPEATQSPQPAPAVTKKPEAPQKQAPGQQTPAQNRQHAPQKKPQQKPQEPPKQAPSQPAPQPAKKPDLGKTVDQIGRDINKLRNVLGK